MDYEIIKSGLTPAQCSTLLDQCKKLEQKNSPRYYPGFSISDNSQILNVLQPFAKSASIANGWNQDFDLSFGTGVNFFNAAVGEKLGRHIDKPLYELDENYQVKPEFDNRYCSKTVIACLSSEYSGGLIQIFTDEEKFDEIRLDVGDVLVINGLTPHQLAEVKSGVFYALCAFFCANT